MDAQKFGSFVAAVRREQGMTQSQLAQQLKVTDKAVSRWERGVGFPDIGTLAPLAQALGVSVVELMNGQRSPAETIPKAEAEDALENTVEVARRQGRRLLRRLGLTLGAAVLAVSLWFLATGLMTRQDVFLWEHAALPSGDAILLRVGISSPMGYVRSCKDVSGEDSRMVLRFYSAFGGLNSDLGAENTFLLPLDPDCQVICFEEDGEERRVLEKDGETGEWVTVKP